MVYAFISGASRGIGKGIAYKLAKEGYDLVLCCEKNGKALLNVSDDIRSRFGRNVLTYVGDIGDSEFVSMMGSDVISKIGGVDVLINNAGIAKIGLLTDTSPEEWDRIISVNLSSCYYTARAFLPAMIRKKCGHIINISSMWGRVGASCEVAYSASKGGMDAFTRALSKELAPSHIRVNAISCGVIDTDMNAELSPEDMEALKNEIPADRLGTPDDVADAVYALLISGDYLTGQIIGVEGGYI